ncbi:6-bladed beta-propeller [candidate division KSB1 bacterium]
MINRSICFIFFLIVVINLNCGSDEAAYTEEIIDGVRHVHNIAPAWGENPKVELKLVKKIGDLEAEEDHLIFYRPSGFARDSQGNRFVMDSGNFRIVMFDRDWNFVRTIGREGEGPGEFTDSVHGLDVDGNDRLVTHNPLSRKVQFLSSEGKYIDGFSHAAARVFYYEYAILENGKIAAALITMPYLENYEEEGIVKFYDTEGKFLEKAGKIDPGEEEIYFEVYNGIYMDAAKNNTVVVAYQYMNKIAKFSDNGSTLWTADRPLDYEIRHSVAESFTTETTAGVAVDEKNRIWVLTFKQQPENNQGMPNTLKDHDIIFFEIFDENGKLLGSIPTPNHVTAIRIFGDNLYMIDTYTNHCVYEYQIIEK